jgi:hypothetical protein
MKNVLQVVNWFIQGLFEEFLDFSKRFVVGSLGVALIIIWMNGGIGGKVIVWLMTILIVSGAIARARNKITEQKVKRQWGVRIANRIDYLNDNLGEMAAYFQKYLDNLKEAVNDG